MILTHLRIAKSLCTLYKTGQNWLQAANHSQNTGQQDLQ